MKHLTSTSTVAGWIGRLAAAACLTLAAGAAPAQSFPSKPIRIIVPFAAGGALDGLMRRMGAPLSESVGQPVVIDNRPGGMTNIGMQACANAAPDGYTVCFTLEDSIVYNQLLFSKLPYDPAGLVPVINLSTPRSVIVAKANAPFNTLKEMIGYARSNPGKLNFGTWGPSSTPDLYRQWINRSAAIDMVSVPYKGVAAGTMQAILAGEIDASLFTVGQILPHIQAGKVKPIAVLGDKRFAGLPNVGTLADEGADPSLPGAWGIYAPPGTPGPLVDRLNAEFAKALAHPSVRELLAANTLDPIGGSALDFARFLTGLRSNAQRVFRALDIKPMDQPS